jgi:hypothetical protein
MGKRRLENNHKESGRRINGKKQVWNRKRGIE